MPKPEKELAAFFREHPALIELGLTILAEQVSTPAGRLDALAKDLDNNPVVIEYKLKPQDSVVGQITRYMGWVGTQFKKRNLNGVVRGIIVCRENTEKLQHTIKIIPNLTVKEFGKIEGLEYIGEKLHTVKIPQDEFKRLKQFQLLMLTKHNIRLTLIELVSTILQQTKWEEIEAKMVKKKIGIEDS